MKQSQLPQDVAVKIVADNPQYTFLRKLLPLYEHVPRSRKATSRPVRKYHGWEIEEDSRGRYIANRVTFTVDTEGFRIGERPTIVSYFVGLPVENPDDIVNFQKVKTISPFALMLYEVPIMLPKSLHDGYLVDPEKLG